VFARRESERAECLWFVSFAVSNESPDFRFFAGNKSASPQVTVETCLINREQRSKAHRDRWELPEFRHEVGMWIRRQPSALGQLLAKILQMAFINPALQVSARVNSGSCVSLEINQVAGELG